MPDAIANTTQTSSKKQVRNVSQSFFFCFLEKQERIGSRKKYIPAANKSSVPQNVMAIKAKEYTERLSQVKTTTSSASYAARVAFSRYYGIQSSSASKRSHLPLRPSPPPSFSSSCPSSASSPSSQSSSTPQSSISLSTDELNQACFDLGAKIDADRKRKVGRRTFYRGQSAESEDHESNEPSNLGPSLVFVCDLATDGADSGACHWVPAIDLGDSYLPLPDPDRVIHSWRYRTCRNIKQSKWRKFLEKVKIKFGKLKVWNRYEGTLCGKTL